MVHFLLKIDGVDQSFKELMVTADYIEDKTGDLTASGFQFILMDEPSQVHQVVLAFLKNHFRKGENLLQFVFSLLATQSGIWYSLSAPREQHQRAL